MNQMKVLLPWEPNDIPLFVPGSVVRKRLGKNYAHHTFCECRVWIGNASGRWVNSYSNHEKTFDTKEDAIKNADQLSIQDGWTLIDDINKADKLKLLA